MNSKKSRAPVVVIGLGYVGLPLALRFSICGHSVIGIDVDPIKVKNLRDGTSYIRHVSSEILSTELQSGNLNFSTDYSVISEARAVIICVPTPLSKNREPDLSFVEKTARSIAPHLRHGVVVVLESTTYPGTTDGCLRSTLEDISGLSAGRDFYLAFSPEREDPGRGDMANNEIPKIIGGYTEECLTKCLEVYGGVIEKLVPVSSCRVAEATKLMENIFRSVNIALVNELKVVYAAMDIDIWEVIEAARTKPFGFLPFYPGPGLGGHCIPIDPFYLTWKAREFGMHTRFIELAGEINTSMPDYVLSRINDALNDQGKSVRGSRILIVGLAYKADVDDIRESPSLVLIERLETRGAMVEYNDPYVDVIPTTREHSELAGRKSQAITADYDCLVIATAHTAYRSMEIGELGVPVVDSRRLLAPGPLVYQA